MKTENIKVFYIGGGETFLGEVLTQTENEIMVKNVVRVIEQQSQDGKNVNITLYPFMSFCKMDEPIYLSKATIFATATPVQEILNNYEKQFSKIIKPDQPKLQI